MTALGIDLGGTKIAAQLFAADWSVLDSRQIATPSDYGALVRDLTALVRWADGIMGRAVPVGIGAAGLVNPVTGQVLAANHVADGAPLPSDLQRAVGRPVTYLNDARAVALSEAAFGAGIGYRTVATLIIGTGVGGGLAMEGRLHSGASQTGGECGHISAPAHLVVAHDLPVLACGCGRAGCIETLISGPGLARIGQRITGQLRPAPELIGARGTDPGAQRAWDIWCALTADLIRTLILTWDPDCIVLGGGLSGIAGLAEDLQKAASDAHLPGFAVPPIVIAQGGALSGARGAAYAARDGVA